MEFNTVSYKLVLLGDTSVGKSSCVGRFVKNEFLEYQQPTIGAAFLTQTVDLGTHVVKFEIWDTAGTISSAMRRVSGLPLPMFALVFTK